MMMIREIGAGVRVAKNVEQWTKSSVLRNSISGVRYAGGGGARNNRTLGGTPRSVEYQSTGRS